MEAGKKVFRTETIMIRRSENITMLAHLSKNLYNEANCIVRQTFTEENRWIRKYELNMILRASENFRTLPALSAQQTIADVDDAWKAFFRAMKECRKDPKKFPGKPWYEAEEQGIYVVVTEEDHTSICSFLDGEEVRHHATYAGKGISRGMFRSHNGTLINADLNAAYNMIRKVFPDAFADGIRGVGLHPVGLNISEMNNPLNAEESQKF